MVSHWVLSVHLSVLGSEKQSPACLPSGLGRMGFTLGLGGEGGPGTLAGKPGLLRQQTIQVSGDLASPPNPGTWGRMCPPGQRVLGGPVSPSCPLLSAFGLWEGLQPGARRTTQLAGFEPVLRAPPWAWCGPQGGGGTAGCRGVAPGRLHQARWVVSGSSCTTLLFPGCAGGGQWGFLTLRIDIQIYTTHIKTNTAHCGVPAPADSCQQLCREETGSGGMRHTSKKLQRLTKLSASGKLYWWSRLQRSSHCTNNSQVSAVLLVQVI